MIKVELKTANAKESGRPYEYISLSFDGVEFQRVFIKNTEKEYYSKMLGTYKK